MKKLKLIKALLIPIIGITSIGTIAAVSTSCSSSVVPVTGVSLKEKLKIELCCKNFSYVAKILNYKFNKIFFIFLIFYVLIIYASWLRFWSLLANCLLKVFIQLYNGGFNSGRNKVIIRKLSDEE